MRIRLRVPVDGDQLNGGGDVKSVNLLGWLRSLLASSRLFCPASGMPSKHDKRWLSRGDTRYCVAGRCCVRRDGDWQVDYIFDVISGGGRQQVRIGLPEPLIAAWEGKNNRRMSEACRLRLVHETLEVMIDLNRLPPAITVSAGSIAAVKL
ncbi:MAG: hypothetical protein ACKV2U_18870 [Bryobacteraceae bacterium]